MTSEDFSETMVFATSSHLIESDSSSDDGGTLRDIVGNGLEGHDLLTTDHVADLDARLRLVVNLLATKAIGDLFDIVIVDEVEKITRGLRLLRDRHLDLGEELANPAVHGIEIASQNLVETVDFGVPQLELLFVLGSSVVFHATETFTSVLLCIEDTVLGELLHVGQLGRGRLAGLDQEEFLGRNRGSGTLGVGLLGHQVTLHLAI